MIMVMLMMTTTIKINMMKVTCYDDKQISMVAMLVVVDAAGAPG